MRDITRWFCCCQLFNSCCFIFELQIIFCCFHKLEKTQSEYIRDHRRRWSFIMQFLFPSTMQSWWWGLPDSAGLVFLNTNCKSECTWTKQKFNKNRRTGNMNDDVKNTETKLGWFSIVNCLCFSVLWDAPDYYFCETEFPLTNLNSWYS